MKDLGTLPGYPASAAQAINAGGEVVGYATASTGGTQGVPLQQWRDGGPERAGGRRL